MFVSIEPNINKCSKNTFIIINLFATMPLFHLHLINEAVKGVVYHCFTVSVKNDKLSLLEVMFHVLCFIVSDD